MVEAWLWRRVAVWALRRGGGVEEGGEDVELDLGHGGGGEGLGSGE